MSRCVRDLTTTEVASALQISVSEVKRCLRDGTLKGYQVPGSLFWRVPAFRLREFARRYEIPLERSPT